MLTPLIFAFMMLALVPFVKGFATSISSPERGTTTDADYWYLIQNSIMIVLGNIVTVLPLLSGRWFSARYLVMWVWFVVGLLLAGLSVVIYPLCNTGWSSLLALFSSLASFAAALELTQAMAAEKAQGGYNMVLSNNGKAKQE